MGKRRNRVCGADVHKDINWTAPLRVDNELSDEAQWRSAHEEDKTALRPGVQDISSG
jgi:hypothetical protein